jgi:hypothetical protein
MSDRGVCYQFNGGPSARETYYSILSLRANGGACRDLPVQVHRLIPEGTFLAEEWVSRLERIPRTTVLEWNYQPLGSYLVYHSQFDRYLRRGTMASPPFKTTLHLDSDTLILKPIERLFEVAEAQGIAAIRDHGQPFRRSLTDEKIWQYNGGVFAFTRKAGERIVAEIERLIALGQTTRLYPSDQPPLEHIAGQSGTAY